jgi:protein-disulfide isomerase/uncharacterized membrane protein
VSPTLYNRLLVLFSYAGIFVAGVLSMAARLNLEVPCGVSHGCEAVAQDPSSRLLWHTPNAYFGFVGYIVLAALATYRELAGIGTKFGKASVYLGYVCAAVGTLVSMYLTYTSITVIHATCYWCLMSAVLMTLSLLCYMMLAMNVDKAPAKPPAGMYGLISVPLFAVCAVLGIAAVSRKLQLPDTDPVQVSNSQLAVLIGPDAHVKNPNGVVTVIEFGDLACPNCKHTYPQIEQAVANSNGKMRYAFHHFPLYMNAEHVAALPGAVISEMAAEKGLFWKYLDLAYGGADSPSTPMPTTEDMIQFGVKLGLSEKDIRARMADKSDPAMKRVMADLDLDRLYNIDHTPSFIVMTDSSHTVKVAGSGIFSVLKQAPFKDLLK